jgi:hypothetical protein
MIVSGFALYKSWTYITARVIGQNGCQHVTMKGVSDTVVVQQCREGSSGLQEPSSFGHDQTTRQGEDLEGMSGAKHDEKRDSGFRE